MVFFDRQIKIILIIYLVFVFGGLFFGNDFGLSLLQRCKYLIYAIVKPYNKPTGTINLSFTDSFWDTWNKIDKYPYLWKVSFGYDLCLMSELPSNQIPLPHRMYLAKETNHTLKYVVIANSGKKVEGTLNIDVGEQDLTKTLLNSKKAEILRITKEREHTTGCEPDQNYEMCLMAELPIDQEPLPNKIYITNLGDDVQYLVISHEGQKVAGKCHAYRGGWRLSKAYLTSHKYQLLKITADRGHTACLNTMLLATSDLNPTKLIINNGKITINFAEAVRIYYSGQDGKIFNNLRIDLINKWDISLAEYIAELKELIKSIDAAGWKRAPGYERVIGKLDDKLMVIRLFDIPTPIDVDFMRWTKGEYVLSIDGHAEIKHDPKAKKPHQLKVWTSLEINKDVNFK